MNGLKKRLEGPRLTQKIDWKRGMIMTSLMISEPRLDHDSSGFFRGVTEAKKDMNEK